VLYDDAMDTNEFNGKVKGVPVGNELIFDVRVFGPRQGEAVDSYLHARLMGLNMGGIGATDNHVVLICDSVGDMPNTARNWLNNLNAAGQSTEIRQAVVQDFCSCGHAFASHSRKAREDAHAMQVDDALLLPKRYDINADRAAGESACVECTCHAYTPKL
jgi:hypothetical protein